MEHTSWYLRFPVSSSHTLTTIILCVCALRHRKTYESASCFPHTSQATIRGTSTFTRIVTSRIANNPSERISAPLRTLKGSVRPALSRKSALHGLPGRRAHGLPGHRLCRARETYPAPRCAGLPALSAPLVHVDRQCHRHSSPPCRTSAMPAHVVSLLHTFSTGTATHFSPLFGLPPTPWSLPAEAAGNSRGAFATLRSTSP